MTIKVYKGVGGIATFLTTITINTIVELNDYMLELEQLYDGAEVHYIAEDGITINYD